MRVPRQVLSVFMSVVLTVGLCPGVAHAGELVGAGVQDEALAGEGAQGAALSVADGQDATFAGETEGEVIVGDVVAADGILQEGGLIQAAPASSSAGLLLGTQSEPDVEGFEAALSAAAEAWDGVSESVEVDVTQYGISRSEFNGRFNAFCNRNGQFFYLSAGKTSYYSNVSGIVTRLVVGFDTTFTAANREAFDSAVNAALSGVDLSWSDEQKALYLHDWLVTHCEYDLTYSKYSAYNALVEGSAVCQGYSLAYDYLLGRAGVECDVVTSNGINHAWNLVTVDASTYYIDCTWDDPSNIFYESYCRHVYFLKSRSSFEHTGDDAANPVTDWVDTSGANVYRNSSIAYSTAYDSGESAYWANALSAIPHVGSMWAYVDSSESGQTASVYAHDYATGRNVVLASGLPARWNVWGETSYWTRSYTNLIANGQSFLASTPSTLVMVGLDGTQSKVYQLTAAEAAAGYIYGLTYEPATGVCRYELGTVPNNAKPTGRATFDFPPVYDLTGATVAVEPQVYAGAALTPKVTVALADGTTVPSSGYSVSVSGDCVNAGTYDVTVIGVGANTGVAMGSFQITPKPVTVAAQPASKRYGTSDPALAATVEGLAGNDAPTAIRYELSREQGEDVGEYAIYATGAELQGNYRVTFLPATFSISVASIAGAALELSENSFTYNGEVQRPTVVSAGGKVLVPGVDYSVSYSNPSSADAGSYTVQVRGVGNYTGVSTSATYVIKPKAAIVSAQPASKAYGASDPELVATVEGLVGDDAPNVIAYNIARDSGEDVGEYAIRVSGSVAQGNYVVSFVPSTFSVNAASIDGLPLALSATSFTYNGSAQKPTVRTIGGKALKAGVDYVVNYETPDSAAVGRYKVHAEGVGNYRGVSAEATYDIAPKSVTVVAQPASKAYGEPDPELTATVGGLIGDDAVAYELRRAGGESVGSYPITASYDAEQGNYLVAFVGSTFAVKAASLAGASLELSAASFTFNGETQRPQVKVAFADGKALAEGADYTLEWSNANSTAAGGYTVQARGIGNYDGTSIGAAYAIEPAPLDGLAITLSQYSYSYSGKAQMPAIATIGGQVLAEGVDYELVCSSPEPSAPGAYTVHAVGLGNYVGTSADAIFEITPISIQDADIELSATSFTYNGAVQAPKVIAVGGAELVEGEDYTVWYSAASSSADASAVAASTAVGSYQVWVEGKGHCEGESKPATYEISPKLATVTAQPASKTYGEADPAIGVIVDGLASGEDAGTIDFNVTREQGNDAGSYVVTVSGAAIQGNYVVTYESATFTIRTASLSKAAVSNMKTKTYTGKALKQVPVVKVGSTTLKAGVDYVLSYENNVKAGKATLTVKGKGNYAGSVLRQFSIAKAANPMNVVAKTAKVKYSKKKTQTVKAKGAYTFKKQAVGKVTYKRVAKGSSKYLTVNANTGNITVKAGAPKGKTQSVKVKLTAKGNSNYKAASKTVTVKVKVR